MSIEQNNNDNKIQYEINTTAVKNEAVAARAGRENATHQLWL